MALSLNDKKLKPSIAQPQRDLPKKTLTMPWQDREARSSCDGQELQNSKEDLPSEEKAPQKQERNLGRTINKPVTNRQQTGNEDARNRKQTINKPVTNRQQTGNEDARNRKQTINKPSTELLTKPLTKIDVAQTKLLTNVDLAELSGIQERALFLLFDSCRHNGSRRTEPIINTSIADLLKTTPNSAKVSLHRLKAKGFIRRSHFKNGRGGWAVFEIPEDVYQAISLRETRTKLLTNRQQTVNKPSTELLTKPLTNRPSSSSYELKEPSYITTTTGAENLGSEWTAIDVLPLTETGVKFGQPQIAQIAKAGSVTPEELQDSIRMFAFDLVHNQKHHSIKGDPLNFFVGILRNGPYLPPQNYRSPQEIQKRAYADWKRKQQENLKSLDWEIADAEFHLWWGKLADSERAQYSPRKVGAEGASTGSAFHLECVKELVFMKTIWPAFQAMQASLKEDQNFDFLASEPETLSDQEL